MIIKKVGTFSEFDLDFHLQELLFNLSIKFKLIKEFILIVKIFFFKINLYLHIQYFNVKICEGMKDLETKFI
jgi:hypothetical protein